MRQDGAPFQGAVFGRGRHGRPKRAPERSRQASEGRGHAWRSRRGKRAVGERRKERIVLRRTRREHRPGSSPWRAGPHRPGSQRITGRCGARLKNTTASASKGSIKRRGVRPPPAAPRSGSRSGSKGSARRRRLGLARCVSKRRFDGAAPRWKTPSHANVRLRSSPAAEQSLVLYSSSTRAIRPEKG